MHITIKSKLLIQQARKQQQTLEVQRELHAFSPVGSDTFLDEDESEVDEDYEGDASNVRYIVAPKTSEPRIASANN